MPNRTALILALIVAAATAVSAALSLSAFPAFVMGGVVALGAAWLLRPRELEAEGLVPAREAAVAETNGHAPVRALAETLPSPLLVIAQNGRITYANSAAQRSLPRMLRGAHFASVIRAPAFVEAVTATLGDGQPRELQFATHQGRDRFLEARIGPLPDDTRFGPEPQVIVQIDDRTEARRAEQQRSDFIANASHELRTPLASIIGYIETLQNHAREDAAAREKFLGIMAREAGRMQRLVDDLMSLSRIELTEHVRPDEIWSLNAIASESATALLPLARRSDVTLKIELEPSGALVLGDRDQLEQVFANLIDNAMKYGGCGGTVRVFAAAAVKAHPNRWGVTVADAGPGVAREHLHRLTERFYRVNAASSRTQGGTGLGLAIVKHILNRHEGRLEIASEPGSGSAFTVWLPRAGGDTAKSADGAAQKLSQPAAPGQ